MKVIINILLFIWQILQNIVGLIYLGISLGNFYEKRNGNWIFFTTSNQGSVSLGNFVFISSKSKNMDFTIKHELGHCIQSRYLGPLYLLVIGIPSITWVMLRRMIPELRKYNYYDFYTESWANKLMNI